VTIMDVLTLRRLRARYLRVRELLDPEREGRRLLRYVSRSWCSKEEFDRAFRQSVEDERDRETRA
jgi:hypothetical protein